MSKKRDVMPLHGTTFGLSNGRSADWSFAGIGCIELVLNERTPDLSVVIKGWCGSAEAAQFACWQWNTFGKTDSSFHETTRETKWLQGQP